MSEVSLSIGGRSYKVACAPGEEDHVTRLGAAIDAKLQAMPQLSGQDAQNLLFGALLLADDLHELRNANTAAQDQAAQARERAERLEGEVERLKALADEAHEQRRAAEALRGELDALRSVGSDERDELEAARKSEAGLRDRVEALVRERDDLREELGQARNAPPPAVVPFDDPELVPALERFADLLETCADKLEGRRANP